MDNEDTVQIITIPVSTTMDPSELLDIAIKVALMIEAYSKEATILEEEISVECGNKIYGGE